MVVRLKACGNVTVGGECRTLWWVDCEMRGVCVCARACAWGGGGWGDCEMRYVCVCVCVCVCVRLCGEDHVYALELTCGCLFAGRGPGGTRNLHQIRGPRRGSCPGKLSVFACRSHVSHVKPVLNWTNVCSPEHTSDTSTNYDSFLN